jgi:hypothetical protein
MRDKMPMITTFSTDVSLFPIDGTPFGGAAWNLNQMLIKKLQNFKKHE